MATCVAGLPLAARGSLLSGSQAPIGMKPWPRRVACGRRSGASNGARMTTVGDQQDPHAGRTLREELMDLIVDQHVALLDVVRAKAFIETVRLIAVLVRCVGAGLST